MAEIEGTAQDDTIRGTTDSDIIFGLDGDDTIGGGADHDALFGGAGDDELFGGAGDDHIEGNGGNNSLSGGVGNDSLINYLFETGNYDLTGGSGADVFYSLASGETIIRDFDLAERDNIRIDGEDVITTDTVDLGELGSALFIDGNNTDTYILIENPEDAQQILDEGILFI